MQNPPIPTNFWYIRSYIYTYPDFDASIVIMVIVEVVVIDWRWDGGGWSELTQESYKETSISGLRYQFAIKLITVSLAGKSHQQKLN